MFKNGKPNTKCILWQRILSGVKSSNNSNGIDKLLRIHSSVLCGFTS